MLVFCCVLFMGLVYGKSTAQERTTLAKPSAAGDVKQTAMNINNVVYWMTKEGAGTTSGSPNGTQADYPKGTGGLIYEDGMLWGAKVTDANSQRVRVGGSTYYKGLKAGYAIYNGGVLAGASDPDEAQVWRVRTDYETANLSEDAGIFFNTSSPTQAEIDEVKASYQHDWDNWPADLGAPYEDVDGSGTYDPTVDIPGYPGADQTMWTIANDIPTVVDASGTPIDTIETASNLYGADPVGVELAVTLWAYNFGASDPLGNAVFKSAKMKYVGLPGGPTDAKLDTCYFTQWSDPDLGTYTDDYVGSDTDLSFGFVYNGNTLDGVFNGIYGLPVPAGGYDFLQGPITAAGDTLGMTSFTYFGAGSAIDDPDLSEYNGSLQFFNLMEGYLPRPEYPAQDPWTDLSSGRDTKFVLSGDPVTGSGWIDGIQLPPGDRRLVMASGPFVMNLGDEQEVVLALVGGMGKDNISSLTVAKYHDLVAQYAYDIGFDLPSAPTTPAAVGFAKDKAVMIDWGSDAATIAKTEGIVSKGFEFEGYNVYQLPSATAAVSEGVKVQTYDLVNEVVIIFDAGVDPATGYVIDLPKQVGSNSGLNWNFETDYDEIRKRPMSNGVTYHFAVTAYSYKDGATDDDPFITIESSPAVVSVVPHTTNPGESIATNFGESISLTHTGTAGLSGDVVVVNTDELTGNDYEIYFDQQHYYRDLAGLWKETAYPDSVGKLAKAADMTGTVITGAAIASATIGTIDLVFSLDYVSPDGAWIDGFELDLPDGLTINSWGSINGSYNSYGAGAGQNEVNGTGTMTAGNVITWGDSARTGFGSIEGDVYVVVNIPAPLTFPQTVGWKVFDDGYGTIVDVEGTITLTELGYEYKTIKHWNLKNATTGGVLLEDQWVMSGFNPDHIIDGMFYPDAGKYIGDQFPVTEGFQVIGLSGSYAAPVQEQSITHVGDGTYDWDSYNHYGWAATSKASDAWGNGTESVDILQMDYEIRWTGEYEASPTTVGGLTYHKIKDGTGSIATWVGARNYDPGDHPDSDGNPYFQVRIPFEVWNKDTDSQISVIIYDRIQDATAGGDFYAFNPNDRMYFYLWNEAYDEAVTFDDADGLDNGQNNDANLTWNLISWKAEFETGDVTTVEYANPIQLGSDVLSFTTAGFETGGGIEQADIDMINVYPNPYYGFHELEESRAEKFVSFNHLPVEATIKVYTLGGTMVREINKNDATQFAQWDLNNQYGYPVASGIYIIHINTDHGEKILKLALVRETQVLKYY